MSEQYVIFTPDEVLSSPGITVVDASFMSRPVVSEEQRIFYLRIAAEELATVLKILSNTTDSKTITDAGAAVTILAEFIGDNTDEKDY